MKSGLKLRSSGGFTLIEILISTFIIVLIASLTLPRYRTLQKRLDVVQDVYYLSESIRETQEMALSGKEVEGQFPGGYGIYLERGADHYIIYADNNDTGRYNSNSDSIIKVIYFADEVRATYMRGEAGPPQGSDNIDINFSPPAPETRILCTGDREHGWITVGTDNLDFERRVYINKAGLTYVE